MEYAIQLDETAGLISARATGAWESEKDNLMVDQLLQLVDTSEVNKILLDIRELHFDLSIIQIFQRAKTMREKRLKQNKVTSKVALVYAPADSKRDADMKFFENASQNRGMPYCVFIDMEKAQQWLLAD